jgi:mycothiol synthase
MAQIVRVSPDEFDWSSEEGPAAEVRRIARASSAQDGAITLNEQALLQLKNRGLRDADLWVSTGSTTGHAEGFALRHSDVLDLAVHPGSRRQGVGTALASEALPEGRKVDAWSHGDHPGAARLAELFGVPRERELVIMRRPLSDLQPVVVPDGVEIRSFHPGDEQALLDVNASAFAHHPEQGHMTLEDFSERTSESWFDAAGLFLAVPARPGPDDQPLLGFHWTKVHRDEDPPYGEVYVVAVNPKAAGRGLGTVLTGVGLQHLKDQGLESVLLYVDGDNDPAIAVYTGQGFEVERTEVQYRGTSAGLTAG